MFDFNTPLLVSLVLFPFLGYRALVWGAFYYLFGPYALFFLLSGYVFNMIRRV